MIAQEFVEKSRRLLTVDYLPKIERSLGAMSEEDIWWRPGEASNSAGNLVLHLCGNLRQWIIGGVGRRPYQRERQREFDERTPRPRAELLATLAAVVSEVDAILAGLDASELEAHRKIQNHDVTVLEAVYHVVEHFGMHTGQIIMLAKMRTDRDLGLWRPRPSET